MLFLKLQTSGTEYENEWLQIVFEFYTLSNLQKGLYCIPVLWIFLDKNIFKCTARPFIRDGDPDNNRADRRRFRNGMELVGVLNFPVREITKHLSLRFGKQKDSDVCLDSLVPSSGHRT